MDHIDVERLAKAMARAVHSDAPRYADDHWYEFLRTATKYAAEYDRLARAERDATVKARVRAEASM